MKVASLNQIQSNVNFGYVKQEKKPVLKKIESMEDSEKIKLGLTCMAIFSTAAIAIIAAKKKDMNVVQLIKTPFSKLADKFSNKPKQDPIVKKLQGKRDAEAVRIYNAYKAQKKLDSFHKKFLEGILFDKDEKAFMYLTINEEKLKRAAQDIRRYN